MNKLGKKIKTLSDRLLKNIKRPEMRVLPGQLAFFFFLTLIPLLALIGVLVSLLDLPYNSISDLLSTYFPDGTAMLLNAISSSVNFDFNIFLFFITSLILSSNGTHSMIIASNQIYKIDDRSYLKRRLKAMAMVVILVILLLFVLFIPVFGDLIFKTIALIDNSSTIKNVVVHIYGIVKYPLSIVFIYYFIKILYILAPDKKISRKNVVYGSIFTSISWVFLTWFYSIYIENFTNYTTFYGSIASILILMLWLYLLAYLFVLGMALNVTKYELNEEKTNKI